MPSGWSCTAGYAGTVSAVSSSPFYSSSCSQIARTANSNGDHGPSGCSGNAGYAGTALAVTSSPFYNSSCSEIACPANLNGDQVPRGCSCNAGYAGTVSAVTSKTFYSSSCSEIACPANSNGDHVTKACSCNSGCAGTVSLQFRLRTMYERIPCRPLVSAELPSMLGSRAGRAGAGLDTKMVAGYVGTVSAVTSSPFTAAQAQRRPSAEWGYMQCRLCRHGVGWH